MTIPSDFHKMSIRDEPLKLLIVDDDDVDRERVRRMLVKIQLKNDVTEAASLEEARSILNSGNYDCIFLDYRLGDALGTDLLKEIQFTDDTIIPVVMITGMGTERMVVEAMQNGAYDYIPKTQLQVDLLETVLVNSMLRANLERELKIKRERLEFLSFYDALTELPNRSLFFDRLNQIHELAQRNQRKFAVLGIDLDYFKEVNDNFGHSVGDHVLNHIAQRIAKVIRCSDTVARIGGDEFAVILVEPDSEMSALRVADKIVEVVNEPIVVDQHLIHLGASVGVALYPDHGTDIQTLLQRSDSAMYTAKKTGMSMIFGEGMEAHIQKPLPEISRLQEAIDKHELYFEFQPIIELTSGHVAGVEALVRWLTPEGKIIPPAAFIPKAERTPLIIPLSYAIINSVLDFVQQWHQINLLVPISINLSARMLEDIHLPKKILHALHSRNLHASVLTLELTETALLSNVEKATNTLGALLAAGVRISIDDFGAGFTSFKYLRQLGISEIKIDMAFTGGKNGCRDGIIVNSIATLAEGFGVPSVAEGIENIDNIAYLLELGCLRGQGFAIAPPMQAPALQQWLLGKTIQPAAA
jgi:diguanylate cyclase